MNSAERREARYKRRKEKRERKKQARLELYGNYDKVFTFENLYRAYKKCCKGVGRKASTQRYRANALLNIVKTLDLLLSGKYKSRGFYEIDLVERGKPRHIKFVQFSERVVQRCLCDYSYVPMTTSSLIYDNGAGFKGKGVDFAVNRLAVHLQKYYSLYGNVGYALTYDFRKYFDSISHRIVTEKIRNIYEGNRLGEFLNMLVNDFGGDKGLGLGSQISQTAAVSLPNRIDHYAKERLDIKFYGRYMDDGYLINESKEYLRVCLSQIRILCEELEITINEKKTQIVKLSRGIPFLKRRFILTDTGKVVRIPAKDSVVRMRRKLKVFRRWLNEKKPNFTFAEVLNSYMSWRGHLKHSDAFKTIDSTDKLFIQLFKEELYGQSTDST